MSDGDLQRRYQRKVTAHSDPDHSAPSMHAGKDYYQRKKDPAFVRGTRKRGRQNYRANKRLREAHPEEFKRYLADEKAGDEQSLIRRRNGT